MRGNILKNNQFPFMEIYHVAGSKQVNHHAAFEIIGLIPQKEAEALAHSDIRQQVTFTAIDSKGVEKPIFTGLIDSYEDNVLNDVHRVTVRLLSNSVQTDQKSRIRTFQDSSMKYSAVTNAMKADGSNFECIWPRSSDKAIGNLLVQYKETDWEFIHRIASKLGTVVVPDTLLDTPYISIGIPSKAVQEEISALRCTQKKQSYYSSCAALDGSRRKPEKEGMYYEVVSRDIYDLCDPIPFRGKILYVYAVRTVLESEELVNIYTLKEKEAFVTPAYNNQGLIGASLHGKVRDVKADHVQVKIDGDIKQSNYKWLSYATPFSSADGPGWYFMPEVGDSIRLRFPSEEEKKAYVSSAVHVTHGDRSDAAIKYIRTVYDQEIRFSSNMVSISDGAGSSIVLDHERGIRIDTDKNIELQADGDISMMSNENVDITGGDYVELRNNDSFIRVDEAIDISSRHTRIQ